MTTQPYVLDPDSAESTDRQPTPLRVTRREWSIPVGLGVALLGLLFAGEWLQLRNVGDRIDLAIFSQAAWLVTHGPNAFMTIRNAPVLGDHASFLFLAVAQVTRVFPTVPALLFVQALALAAGVPLIFLVARRDVGLTQRMAVVLSAAYCVYPAVWNVALADFHPEVVAVPALLGAVHFALRRRRLPYAVCIAVVLLSKEDLGIVTAMLGVTLLTLGRPWRVAGAVTCLTGIAWTLLTTQLVIPHFGGMYIYGGLFPDFGKGLAGSLAGIVTHPGAVLRDVFTLQNLRRLLYPLLAPLLLLPLLKPRWLVPIAPTLFLLMIAARPSMHSAANQYAIPLIPFMFVAAAMALATHTIRNLTDRFRRAAPAVLLVTGAVLFTRLTVIGRDPTSFLQRTPVQAARIEAARRIPARAAVSVTFRLAPYLSLRTAAYEYPFPFAPMTRYNDPVPVAVRRAGVDWIVLDTSPEDDWSSAEAAVIDDLVRRGEFVRVSARDGVLVYKRVARVGPGV